MSSLPPASYSEKTAPPKLQLVRRRGDREQGRALEALGHAVEYLVDSRMFLIGESNREADAEAVQILMRASRSVFESCPEVVPVGRRFRRWAEEHLFGAA